MLGVVVAPAIDVTGIGTGMTESPSSVFNECRVAVECRLQEKKSGGGVDAVVGIRLQWTGQDTASGKDSFAIKLHRLQLGLARIDKAALA